MQQTEMKDEYVLISCYLARRNAEKLAAGVVCDESQTGVVRQLREMLLEFTDSDAVVIFGWHTRDFGGCAFSALHCTRKTAGFAIPCRAMPAADR